MRRRWTDADARRLHEAEYYILLVRDMVANGELTAKDKDGFQKDLVELADWIADLPRTRKRNSDDRPQRKPIADYLINIAALAFGGATMWFLWQIFQAIRVWVENADKL